MVWYQNTKLLIATKVGLLKFEGNLATRWGKVFENITVIETIPKEIILSASGIVSDYNFVIFKFLWLIFLIWNCHGLILSIKTSSISSVHLVRRF